MTADAAPESAGGALTQERSAVTNRYQPLQSVTERYCHTRAMKGLRILATTREKICAHSLRLIAARLIVSPCQGKQQ